MKTFGDSLNNGQENLRCRRTKGGDEGCGSKKLLVAAKALGSRNEKGPILASQLEANKMQTYVFDECCIHAIILMLRYVTIVPNEKYGILCYTNENGY